MSLCFRLSGVAVSAFPTHRRRLLYAAPVLGLSLNGTRPHHSPSQHVVQKWRTVIPTFPERDASGGELAEAHTCGRAGEVK